MRKIIFKKPQSGQVVILLLLVMLVGLSIGLSLTQRSVTDVATSTQTEQSSRAFSAAEAGIEKALSGSIPATATITLSNDSSSQVSRSVLLPIQNTFAGIEYPPIGRETTAHFWFTDPSLPSPPSGYYNSGFVDLYFGNANTTDAPAAEVVIVMQSGNQFYTQRYYYDSDSNRAQGTGGNNFTPVACSSNAASLLGNGILGSNSQFHCKVTVGQFVDQASPSRNCPNSNSPCILILARVRLLYINENHKVALAPVGAGIQFPPQVEIYNSVGTAGQSQKQIQAFKVQDVVPPWFDYALFSIAEISK